jgi:hypothetical protein
MKIGDRVMDDLTEEEHTIIEIIGNDGFKVDSEYLEGYRFGWEITPLDGDSWNESISKE